MFRLLITLLLLSLPASAGTIDARGQWVSTQCQQPAAPQFRDGGGNAFNYNVRINGEYTRAVQAYLKCLADEVNADQQARLGLAVDLNAINDAWIGELAQRQIEMDGKRAR